MAISEENIALFDEYYDIALSNGYNEAAGVYLTLLVWSANMQDAIGGDMTDVLLKCIDIAKNTDNVKKCVAAMEKIIGLR